MKLAFRVCFLLIKVDCEVGAGATSSHSSLFGILLGPFFWLCCWNRRLGHISRMCGQNAKGKQASGGQALSHSRRRSQAARGEGFGR